MTDTRQYQNVGGLWQKTSKNGKPYLSGKLIIEGREVVVTVWENDFKRSSADVAKPDYTVQAMVITSEPAEEHPF